MKPSSHMVVKLVATLTVLVANIVVSHQQISFHSSLIINYSVAAGLRLHPPPLPTGQPGGEHQVPGGRGLHPPALSAGPHHGHPGQRLLVVQPLPLSLHDGGGRDGPPQQAERGRARLQGDHPAR